MALTQTSNFSRVVVDFNNNLGINSIVAYRNSAAPNEDPNWVVVETLPRYTRNDDTLEGMYNAGEASLAECVRRIRLKTAALIYTFNNQGEITVTEVETTENKIFGHILDHDPIYREIKRQEAAEAGVPDILPVDKIYYKYEAAVNNAPDLPSVTLSNNDLIKHAKDIVTAGWHPSVDDAEEAYKPSDIADAKLYKILVSYYKSGTSYHAVVSRVEEPETIEYNAVVPVTLTRRDG